ncbi:MAG: hypothetical protein U1G07_21530 [Verrucomicrobiota bacterium]
MRRPRWLAGITLALVLLTTMAGCSSTPKVDWAARVGHYSYDQAVLEMGPPDKTAELTDGSLIAVWSSRPPSHRGVTLGLGVGSYSSGSGVSVGQSISTGRGAARELRLTFDKARQLTTWNGQ